MLLLMSPFRVARLCSVSLVFKFLPVSPISLDSENHLTLKMTSAQVVETSVNVISNSPSQDYTHPDDRTLLNKAILMFKMTKGLSPAYFQNLFYTRSTQYNLRDSKAKLELPMPRTNYWKCAFCYSGALLWIRLFVGLRKFDSLGYFKWETDQLYSSCRSDSHMTIL